jgi:hypothetical protein
MTDQNDDLFAGNSPQDNSQKTDGEADLLSELVGEGKKFKTPQDLAKSAVEKDNFIEQLKRENAEMRRSLAKEAKLDAVDTALARLNDKLEKASTESEGTATTKPLSRDDIRAILLEEKNQAEQAANLATIQSQLLSKFGGDRELVKKHVAAKASELGVSPAEIRNMVSRTPEVARTVLGLKQPAASGSTNLPRQTMNTEALDPSESSDSRNKAYYDNLKTKLGHKYWSPSIQQQMFKDAKALGSKFYQ